MNYQESISHEKAKEDIDYFMHYLKKLHPLTKAGIPEEVMRSYNETIDILESSESIDITLLNQLIQNIASTLRDGHTYCFDNYENIHYLKYSRLIRQGESRLLKVNGTLIEDILIDKSNLYSYEVESWAFLQLNYDLTTLEGLYYLGFNIEDGIEYTYETIENGSLVERKIMCQASDFISYDDYIEYNNLSDSDDDDAQFVYYNIDNEKDLAVLTLTECNYNDEYINCLRDLFTDVKLNNINNVAVDLRHNGGGSSLVANEFIRYLNIDNYKVGTYIWRLGKINKHFDDDIHKNDKIIDLLFDGNLYVLTSEGTFSSAMLFACYIKDNGLGLVIGEAPGNTPTGYGEIAYFEMPNSALYSSISTKSFTRADEETDDIVVTPDIPCDAKDALDILSQYIMH
jgi:hypothetical protein